MNRPGARAAALVAVLAGACGHEPAPQPVAAPPVAAVAPEAALKVLFIGNSYTYYNNLPRVLVELAVAGGHPAPTTRMIVPGGTTLHEHWDNESTRNALTDERWDFVVL